MALFAFIKTFSLLSPILLSFLLVLLLSLAVNPVISRMRTSTGGRKIPTGLVIMVLIAGFFEAIPFLGSILSALPALLLAFGNGGMIPLWVVFAYMAIQALENNVIPPFIMARRMKLHPLAVIFSMLLCVAAFGVLGVLVAAPLGAIANIVHDELYRKRFLPSVKDADLDRLAGIALHENPSVGK